ncbi:MAG: transcriptional regulator GcvA [SAR324 cluster bacterium]|nr:transcriptional regulator GcvA [SAR324 cluster bacterium]
MRIELPPLNGFHVFECAARHLSFTQAAKELYVTQAAVSQQIKQLEQNLGFKLFHRLTRQLALTEEGKRLADEVRSTLIRLSEVINELQKDERNGVLTLSTLPGFAVKWLIPRLNDFNQRFPEIVLHLHTEMRLVNFRTDKVDMAIRYGRGDYGDLNVTFMMKDEIFPVCSPQLLKKSGPILQPEDLLKHVLLFYMEQEQLPVPHRDWVTWFNAVGVAVTEFDFNEGMSFNATHMVLEAAIAGTGIALGRTALVSEDLAAGRLVRLFDHHVRSENAYYIVSPESTAESYKIKAFRDWLLEQAQQ